MRDSDLTRRRETAMAITRQEFWRSVYLTYLNKMGKGVEEAAKAADEALFQHETRFQ